jgi:hypothetical protein
MERNYKTSIEKPTLWSTDSTSNLALPLLCSRIRDSSVIIIIIINLFICLNCKWVFTRWQCTTVRHNTQITHITQNNTPHSNTAHKTTHTIKDTLNTMNAMQIQLQLQLNKLILINKYTILCYSAYSYWLDIRRIGIRLQNSCRDFSTHLCSRPCPDRFL